MRRPSADSSSTASGLAWHTRSNCSGVSRRSPAPESGQTRSQVLGEAQEDLLSRREREWPWQRKDVSIRQRAGGPAIAKVCYITMVNHRHLYQAVQVAFE